ncbi:serpin family protein [uncultured Streptomyces sp.]|uniref:serpin family protein n=1 Tax=uncultured Streptomyces sp. TaxID=174707 RepID=UPI00262252A8|nr:serpin family protein [uncultured Streptomyces sp.]
MRDGTDRGGEGLVADAVEPAGRRAAAVRALADRWTRVLTAPGTAPGSGGFACSPAGLWLALAAVAAGARGRTADELGALLGTSGPAAAPDVTEAARELAGTGASAVATGVWSRVAVREEYRAALPDIGFGPLDPAAVDAWVYAGTGGLIERLPLRIGPGTLLALVNVIALKADWEKPFDAAHTRDQPFAGASGASRPVATMHARVSVRDAWSVGAARVVELRCRRGPDGRPPVRVRFVLGEPGAGAARVLPAGWAPKRAGTPLDADLLTVALPRLALRTTLQVHEGLPALGVRTALSDAADFSGLSRTPLAVSEVVQETVVRIEEAGVEAAAVTAVSTRAGSARPTATRPLHLAFDRPFGLVVLAGDTDVPLFACWQAEAPDA